MMAGWKKMAAADSDYEMTEDQRLAMLEMQKLQQELDDVDGKVSLPTVFIYALKRKKSKLQYTLSVLIQCLSNVW